MGPRAAIRFLAAALILLAGVLLSADPAFALRVVRVSPDSDTIDLTGAIDFYPAQGDRIQVSTAPGPDGVTRRVEVTALEAGAHPAWAAFALKNDSDEQLTRLIVAPHFRMVGSGVVWPDLGSQRITTITASQGDAPEREDAAGVDVFAVTLDPGATVTYVAELRAPNVPQIYLWEPEAYKDKGSSLILYQGIVIGIAGLMALFLTVMFIVRGALAFPAAAALAWAVFIYVCIDFGFWRKIFGIEGDAERIWRAGVEASVAATLVAFLFAYLNLRRWHARYLNLALIWLLLLAVVVASSVFNAPVAAGVARISIATVAGVGLLLILSMAANGSSRAAMLIPTWIVLARLGGRRRRRRARAIEQRPRRARAHRRHGADRHADRPDADAERLRHRRRAAHARRRGRAPRAGDGGQRRRHFRLGRGGGPHQHRRRP